MSEKSDQDDHPRERQFISPPEVRAMRERIRRNAELSYVKTEDGKALPVIIIKRGKREKR